METGGGGGGGGKEGRGIGLRGYNNLTWQTFELELIRALPAAFDIFTLYLAQSITFTVDWMLNIN